VTEWAVVALSIYSSETLIGISVIECVSAAFVVADIREVKPVVDF